MPASRARWPADRRTAGSRRPARSAPTRARTPHDPAPGARVRARLGLLMRGMCSEQETMTWSARPRLRSARRRTRPSRPSPAPPARLVERRDHVGGVADRRDREQRVACAPVRSPGAGRSPRRRCRWRSRSGPPGLGQVEAGRGVQRSGERKSATTSMASSPSRRCRRSEPASPPARAIDPQSRQQPRRAPHRPRERLLPQLADLPAFTTTSERTSPTTSSRPPSCSERNGEEARRAGARTGPASRPSSRPRWSKKTWTNSQSTW